MKKLFILAFIFAFLSCEKEEVQPVQPTPPVINEPAQPKIYNGEMWAQGNATNNVIRVNSSEFNYITYKSMMLKTGDTVTLIAHNVGFSSDVDETRIAIRLDGVALFDLMKPGDQDTTVIIQ